MTDTERLQHGRTMLDYRDRPFTEGELSTLRWLLSEAEAAGRARQLAEEEPTVVQRGPTFDAGYASARNCWIKMLRQALDGTAPTQEGEGQ